MASLRLRNEADLESLLWFLAWTTLYPTDLVCPATPDVKPIKGKFVFFTSFLYASLHFPISNFFTVMDYYGLCLNHLSPNSILYISVFVHLCEMFIGVKPYLSLFCHLFVSRKLSMHPVSGYYFQVRSQSLTPYISLGKGPH